MTNVSPTEADVKKYLAEIERIGGPKMWDELESRPPTIGLIGLSGTGKSSSINAICRTNLATSATAACTKDFEYTSHSLAVTSGPMAGRSVTLRVVDAPGLGESLKSDPGYLEKYEAHLGDCDVILWVLAARNRALALDQSYLDRLRRFSDRMIFGINQVDLVDPCDWGVRLPSLEQERNIDEIVADRSAKLAEALGRPVTVVPYSAARGYRLERLYTTLLEACPPRRAWVFGLIKDIKPIGLAGLEEGPSRDPEPTPAPISARPVAAQPRGWLAQLLRPHA